MPILWAVSSFSDIKRGSSQLQPKNTIGAVTHELFCFHSSLFMSRYIVKHMIFIVVKLCRRICGSFVDVSEFRISEFRWRMCVTLKNSGWSKES